MAKFNISINAAKASEVSAKVYAEIVKRKQEKHDKNVQEVINVIVSKIEDAMNKAQFNATILYKEIEASDEKATADDIMKAMAQVAASSKEKENEINPDITCTKDVLGDAVHELKASAGFKVSMFKANPTHPLPYIVVQWDDPDNDECK